MAMSVIPEARRYTVAEVVAFPSDGNRYEVVQGEPLGLARTVLTAPADLTWGLRPDEAEDLVQPDVFVVAPEAAGGEWLDVTRLLLAAEVVSPSSSRSDRVVKRKTYQRHGVPTYWVVDPDARLAEVWHPDDDRPAIVTEILTWGVGPDAPELQLPLGSLWP